MSQKQGFGTDGFPAEFYQHAWDFLKKDLSFQRDEFSLFHLNFGTIILLPKRENIVQIQRYRSICLLNVSFKVFTKVGTNQISNIAESVVQPTQTAFMPTQHILEGVVFYMKPFMNFIERI
jgi:hypothetical protein